MRKHGFILVMILLVLTACNYRAPLVGEASLPIDQALLGTWEFIHEDRAGRETSERVVIRQGSANLYAIEYIHGESMIYFKGWLAELEGIHFVQLEVTGTDDGPVGAKDAYLFIVFSYAFDNGGLVVRSLNTDLVDEDLEETAALQAAFAAHRDDPNLFDEPGKLRKLVEGSENFLKNSN
jgi:hypothetical protein